MANGEFGDLFEKAAKRIDLPVHLREVILQITESIIKSAQNPGRGDFAKGREQMAMHAIALLVGAKNWKQVERIIFPEERNGD